MKRSITLRRWQHEALTAFLAHDREDFLAVACPGAGKTTFALSAARHWLRGERLPLVIVAPTRHLKYQWARSALGLGFHIEPDWDGASGSIPSDMHGIVITYSQAATSARSLRSVSRGGLVVLDEIHHAGGDKAWGDGVGEAFGEAGCRLLLSGTPFRSDDRPIPFVSYTLGDHGDAVADYQYDYGNALADGGVVRPVFFPRFDGHMEWISSDGTYQAAGFEDDINPEERGARLRTALSVEGEWLPTVLTRADQQLRRIRQGSPDAGGLVIATDQDHARGIASLIERRTGGRPALALSDDPKASEVIDAFASGTDPWVVAVRMISEGVDIPRLRVGVHATTTLTSLFFRQAVGRIARWTRGPGSQKAYFFIPDDARLRHHAGTIAEQRHHSIAKRMETGSQDRSALDDLSRAVKVEAQPSLFEALSSVAAGSPTDDGLDPFEDLLVSAADLSGLAVDLPPAPPLSDREPDARSVLGELRTRHARKKELRQWNSDRVVDLVRATGMDHRSVNADLNRMSGVARVAEADEALLRRRLGAADKWLESLRR